jgi:anti-sigma-K factor RskA
MPRSTDTPNPIELVAGYVLNDLSVEESARFREALAQDPTLFVEVQSFQAAFALLPYGLPMAEPAASLKGKILSAARRPTAAPIEDHPPSNLVSITSSGHRVRSWQQRLPAISTGIAAIAVAALGFNQIQSGQQLQQTVALQQQLEETNSQLESLRGEVRTSQAMTALLSDPKTKVYSLVGEESNETNSRGATARVLVKPGASEVTLVAQGLPQPPEGKIYRFWAVTKASATPLYCGQFSQDSGGTAQWTAADTTCMENPLQMMITLDAPSDPTASPGPVVMESFS